MEINKYTIINQGIQYFPENENITYMSVLKSIHNAGFFSCNSIGLLDIMVYFNINKGLPNVFDRYEQYAHYKSYALQNLIPFYFEETDSEIPYVREMVMTHAKQEPQFSDYRLIDFKDTKLFVDKFFQPSEHVRNIVGFYTDKYKIDYKNTCAVFYRGNDKNRETSIASYQEFIDKAKEIKLQNPNIKFLIQPDETEFLFAFKQEFPDSFWFEETPHMMKKDSCMVFETPQEQRAEYGAKYFAAVLAISKCKYMITHSGNGSFWAVLYRGNMDNVYQNLNNTWLS